jgi:superfamily I DNA/RNA helicase
LHIQITFTNKAAAEIRERLGTSDKISKNVFVGTFHSFYQSILELRFKLLGYNRMLRSAFYDKKQVKRQKLTGEFISIYIWSLSVNYRENPAYNFAAHVV